jgi:redox-sensitive bicupin YhaK (pirin superfamily)
MLCDPNYQEFKAANIPKVEEDGIKIKLIAGEALGKKGVVSPPTPSLYLDIEMPKGKKYQQHIPSNWNGLVFVYEGEAVIGANKQKVSEQSAAQIAVDESDYLEITTTDSGCKMILIAGQPLNEPV